MPSYNVQVDNGRCHKLDQPFSARIAEQKLRSERWLIKKIPESDWLVLRLTDQQVFDLVIQVFCSANRSDKD